MTTHQSAAFIALVVLTTACGSGVKAPQTADGRKVSIYLVTDNGIKATMSPEEKDELNELGEWLEEDLTRIFKEGGYEVTRIASREMFSPGLNKFLVVLGIEHYRPGRLSSREEAGLGQGVVEIDTRVELYQSNITLPVLQKTQSNTSAREWTFSAREVNRQAAPAISERINELQ